MTRATRRIRKRIVAEGELILTSPTLIGGGDDLLIDNAILRDADGMPFLPGTSVAGVLRSALTNAGAEAGRMSTLLFGPEHDDPSPHQSFLLVDDGVLRPDAQVTAEIRDGVALDPRRGTVDVARKFDLEVLAVGTRFVVRFELLVPRDPDMAVLALTGFVACLQALEDGAVAFGAKTRRGFGQAQVQWMDVPAENESAEKCRWKTWSFDLDDAKGVLDWLRFDFETSKGVPCASIRELAVELSSVPDLARFATLDADLELEVVSSILIGSGGTRAQDAEKTHLHRTSGAGQAPEPIVSGTTWAGAIGARCYRIANTIALEALPNATSPEEALKVAETLFAATFGPRPGAQDDRWSSEVGTVESVISGATMKRDTRLPNDPWTGGNIDGLIAQVDVPFKGAVRLRLRLEPNDLEAHDATHRQAQVGLLLLALRDLATMELSVGAEASIGRGLFRLRAGNIKLAADDGVLLSSWQTTPDGRELVFDDDDAAKVMQTCVDALRDTLAPSRKLEAQQ